MLYLGLSSSPISPLSLTYVNINSFLLLFSIYAKLILDLKSKSISLSVDDVVDNVVDCVFKDVVTGVCNTIS